MHDTEQEQNEVLTLQVLPVGDIQEIREAQRRKWVGVSTFEEGQLDRSTLNGS